MARNTITAFWDRDNNSRLNDNFIQLFGGQSSVGKQVDDLKSLLVQNSLSDEKIAKLITATPKGVYSTVDELRKAFPYGNPGIYIISADGNWYYWNNTDWVSGGKYQSSGAPSELVFSAVNIIKNGNFANGITGFNIYGGDADYIANQGALSLKGKGGLGLTGIYTAGTNNFTGVKGHKIYIKARMRVTNSECAGFKMYLYDGTNSQPVNGGRVVSSPTPNTWYEKYGVVEVPPAMDGKTLSVYYIAEYSSSAVSKEKVFEIYRPMAIDLTATFGSELEWTADDFTSFLSSKFGSSAWFDGASEISSMKDYIISLKQEINHLKDNEPSQYDLLEDFSDGWTNENVAGTKQTLEQRKNLTGSASTKLELENLQGKSVNLDKKINRFFGNASNSMMIKLWIEDSKDIDFVNVYMGNEADVWGNYIRFSIQGDASGDFTVTGGQLRRGWNYLSLNVDEMIKTNNFSFSNAVKRIRVAVTPKTNNKTSVIFDSIWVDGKGSPKFVFTFDDGWRTVYENAFPKMKKAGIPGTNYVIGEYIANVRDFSNWFQTVDMLKEMEKNGWCSGNHTWMHNYYFGGKHTPESYVGVLEQNRNWMLNNGIGIDGSLHVCYPKGEYDQAVITMMEGKGFKSARAAGCRGTHPIEIDKKYELLSRSFHKDVTLEQAKKWVDIGIASGGTTFFQFHQIPIDDTTSNGQENPMISWSKSKFEALIDYVVSKGLAQNCMSHSEWYDYVERNNLVGG